ncbi:hypothetical protein JD844_026243 [Phrynosoma platyrhinos]|uniref:protein-serine/threonine phosphatase n=1 Tax=Phrynosoma platyrhinos TaxID=52577 RepID=A0ABQ7SEL4_PHRPL|nr:hypothetical protein JD844_026243 [Phrynosoma platyrhinos]
MLNSFFHYLIEHFTPSSHKDRDFLSGILSEPENLNESKLEKANAYQSVTVPDDYMGPRLSFPLFHDDATALLEAFRHKQQLHAHYVLRLFHEARKQLSQLPNITNISTCYSEEITVCGDIHGQLADLFLIFHKEHANKIMKLLQSVFSCLPLGTLVDKKVLIVHGGVSDTTDLDRLAKINRRRIFSVLSQKRKGLKALDPNGLESAKNFQDSSRKCSDPANKSEVSKRVQEDLEACRRRASDMTVASSDSVIIEDEDLEQVITVFSASNYYTMGSNRGLITLNEWANAVESVLQLGLPWRMLRPQLVPHLTGGKLEYKTWLRDIVTEQRSAVQERLQSSLLENIYQNLSNLETIFNIIDTDHSGLISLDEFRRIWKLFSTHMNINISDENIDDLARSIDFNKDGNIDFNEFIEAFRLASQSPS